MIQHKSMALRICKVITYVLQIIRKYQWMNIIYFIYGIIVNKCLKFHMEIDSYYSGAMYGENPFTLFMEIVVDRRVETLVGFGTVDWRIVYERCLKHYL